MVYRYCLWFYTISDIQKARCKFLHVNTPRPLLKITTKLIRNQTNFGSLLCSTCMDNFHPDQLSCDSANLCIPYISYFQITAIWLFDPILFNTWTGGTVHHIRSAAHIEITVWDLSCHSKTGDWLVWWPKEFYWCSCDKVIKWHSWSCKGKSISTQPSFKSQTNTMILYRYLQHMSMQCLS